MKSGIPSILINHGHRNIDMNYYYYISESNDPYVNLAIEQSLMDAVCDEVIVYLWQNDDTIVIGRNQDVYRECDVYGFQNDGGRIARRRSGGGAVYHDLGNLNVSLIARQEKAENANLYGLLCDVFKYVGLSASYNQRNDVLVEGKKVSGCAEFVGNDVICRHGTILINTDISRMQKYLTPGREKLSRNSVESVSARVMNLCEIAKVDISMIIEAIIETTSAREYKEIITNLNNYISLYANEKWIMEGVEK